MERPQIAVADIQFKEAALTMFLKQYLPFCSSQIHVYIYICNHDVRSEESNFPDIALLRLTKADTAQGVCQKDSAADLRKRRRLLEEKDEGNQHHLPAPNLILGRFLLPC